MKILIVEDNIKIADLLKLALEKNGFEADCAYDGEAGRNKLEKSGDKYGLAILDLMLPKLSGKEVCRFAKNKYPSLPVMILTAKSEAEDRKELLEAGADDYMTKPFSFNELLERIKKLIDK